MSYPYYTDQMNAPPPYRHNITPINSSQLNQPNPSTQPSTQHTILAPSSSSSLSSSSSSSLSQIGTTTYLRDITVQNLYELINSYFDSPILQKTKDDHISHLSIYMCKISSLLAGADQRYLIVTTEQNHQPVGSKLPLTNISWKSFQSRTIPTHIPNIPKHSYSPKSDDIYLIPVSLIERYEDHTDYYMDKEGYHDVCITLLHKNKNKYYKIFSINTYTHIKGKYA